VENVGGEEYLAKITLEDPKAFCSMFGRIIPTDPRETGSDDQMTKVQIEVI
jgi:hypothetical protein